MLAALRLAVTLCWACRPSGGSHVSAGLAALRAAVTSLPPLPSDPHATRTCPHMYCRTEPYPYVP